MALALSRLARAADGNHNRLFAAAACAFNCNQTCRWRIAMLLANRRSFISAISATVFGLLSVTCLAADPPKDEAKKDAKPEVKIIKPEEAKDHEGEVVTVEFKVFDGREISSGVCFLNSSSDREDPKRFTAFITGKGLKKFKEDPKT
jgi:hypothetical protein